MILDASRQTDIRILDSRKLPKTRRDASDVLFPRREIKRKAGSMVNRVDSAGFDEIRRTVLDVSVLHVSPFLGERLDRFLVLPIRDAPDDVSQRHVIVIDGKFSGARETR